MTNNSIENRPENLDESRSINLFTAISVVVANTIGTGVFTSLGFQATDIKSGFVLMMLWVVGGIFSFCGALSYGELGAAMPRSGGEYRYLSDIYHPILGFLSGWVLMTVGFAAPIALAAIAFGNYFWRVFPVFNPTVLAIGLTISISLIHTRNLHVSSLFQNFSTVFKIAFIVIFIGCGLALAQPQTIQFLPEVGDGTRLVSSSFAVSLVYVTYSYSGWNASAYIAGEVEQPEKNLLRSMLIGTGIVMLLYCAINFVFLYTTPIEKIAGELEVGYVAAESIFGLWGAKFMGLLISLGMIASVSGMVLAGPRVVQAIGEDIPFFRIFAQHNRQGVPYYGILLQLAIVLVLILTSTFETVTIYLSFTITLSSCLTVLGVFIHRLKSPDSPRPYKTWGYPITPLLFLAIGVWILVFVFKDKPIESLAGLATISLGIPVYFFAAKHQFDQ
jgi:basic amino acid/polyamine antiporter, APA family